jgi:hypothetical protein
MSLFSYDNLDYLCPNCGLKTDLIGLFYIISTSTHEVLELWQEEPLNTCVQIGNPYTCGDLYQFAYVAATSAVYVACILIDGMSTPIIIPSATIMNTIKNDYSIHVRNSQPRIHYQPPLSIFPANHRAVYDFHNQHATHQGEQISCNRMYHNPTFYCASFQHNRIDKP